MGSIYPNKCTDVTYYRNFGYNISDEEYEELNRLVSQSESINNSEIGKKIKHEVDSSLDIGEYVAWPVSIIEHYYQKGGAELIAPIIKNLKRANYSASPVTGFQNYEQVINWIGKQNDSQLDEIIAKKGKNSQTGLQ